MDELLSMLSEDAGAWLLAIVGVGSIFIEVSKIRLNPWTTLFKWIGNALNGELKEELTAVKQTINEVSLTVDENEVKRLRGEILSFGNSLRRSERHTYEDFQYIIEVHDDYEKLLLKLKRTNGVVTETFAYIMSVYRELLDKGTFSEKKG